MTLFNTIDIEIISLIILVFIYGNTSKRAEHGLLQHRLFLAIVAALSVLLIADMTAWIVNGREGSICGFLNWASNMTVFLLDPFVVLAWVLYANHQVYRDAKRLRWLLLLLGSLAALNAVTAVASIFTGWFMTILPGNVYSRGPLVGIHYVLCYLFIMYTMAFIFYNRKRVEKQHFLVMMLYAVPPVIGALLQFFFYGLTLVWSCMTLSVLMIYFGIQDSRLDTDYLTGSYNRRQLDNNIRDKIRLSSRGSTFSAILIDLDGFKAINDSFGHAVGDDALKSAVRLLKGCLRETDFLARYGGDEFLAVMDISDPAILQVTVDRIRQNFKNYNGLGTKPYQLSFSTGYAVYDAASRMSAGDFISHVDRLMYEDKKRLGGLVQ